MNTTNVLPTKQSFGKQCTILWHVDDLNTSHIKKHSKEYTETIKQ